MWKRFVHDYLNFTKKERIGVYTLLFLIVIAYSMRLVLPYLEKEQTYNDTEFRSAIAALEIIIPERDNKTNNLNDFTGRRKAYPGYKSSTPAKGELFYFDPNSLSEEGWQRLGIREKTAATIRKYIAKGGRFKEAGDIAKIWGLNEQQVARLIPYARIEKLPEKPDRTQIFRNESFKSFPSREKTIVDINIGDTSSYISLPGIGSKLARRIINFRDKLGGFHNIDQVAETFGLPDSTFQRIKPLLKLTGTVTRQIDLNTVSLDELKSHPYIRYQLANVIIAYRNQHGDFKDIHQLKNIMVITEDQFNKIAPYVKIE